MSNAIQLLVSAQLHAITKRGYFQSRYGELAWEEKYKFGSYDDDKYTMVVNLRE
jgi:hypothetical protein